MDYDTELATLKADGIEQEDIDAAKSGNLEHPNFPITVFSAAVTKDIINIAGVVTAGFLGTVTNIIFTPILYVYLRKEIRVMKSLKKQATKRFIVAGTGETIPVINMIPWWSVFVYQTYKKRQQHHGKILNFVESFESKFKKAA